MGKRSRRRQQPNHTGIAFVSAAILGSAMVAVVEDVRYSATGVPLWNTWHFHPVSIFIGTVVFVAIFYFLQSMDNHTRAIDCIGPYAPLVLIAGANLVFRMNPLWLVLAALGCTAWSFGRDRKLREQRSSTRRMSSS